MQPHPATIATTIPPEAQHSAAASTIQTLQTVEEVARATAFAAHGDDSPPPGTRENSDANSGRDSVSTSRTAPNRSTRSTAQLVTCFHDGRAIPGD